MRNIGGCKKRKLNSKKGSTLVEIMMSFVAMLLLVSVFAGAISFANRALTTADRIGDEAAETARKLRTEDEAPILPGETDKTKYSFTVVGGLGVNVLFEVDVQRIAREVKLGSGESEKLVKIYQFEPIAPLLPPEGGGG